MTSQDGLGSILRDAMAVPTDTMITLDLPLLLTKLSQLPAGTNPAPSDAAIAPDRPDDADADAAAAA